MTVLCQCSISILTAVNLRVQLQQQEGERDLGVRTVVEEAAAEVAADVVVQVEVGAVEVLAVEAVEVVVFVAGGGGVAL